MSSPISQDVLKKKQNNIINQVIVPGISHSDPVLLGSSKIKNENIGQLKKI